MIVIAFKSVFDCAASKSVINTCLLYTKVFEEFILFLFNLKQRLILYSIPAETVKFITFAKKLPHRQSHCSLESRHV